MSELTQRGPPVAEQAEWAAAGCMLLDGYRVVALARNTMQMGAEAFYVPAVRVLVETMFGMAEAGTPIDLVTVLEALKRTGTLERIGGGGVLDKAVDTAVTPTSAQRRRLRLDGALAGGT